MSASTDPYILRIAGLDKWYGPYHALRDIHLGVQAGERIVVCGPSGPAKASQSRAVTALDALHRGPPPHPPSLPRQHPATPLPPRPTQHLPPPESTRARKRSHAGKPSAQTHSD